jgi:hypothetical protein
MDTVMKDFPEIRYSHDIDEIHRLADWLAGQLNTRWMAHGLHPEHTRDFALDYFQLAERLRALAEDCAEFGQRCAGPIP